MALNSSEIIPGAVAYLSHDALIADTSIDSHDDGLDRDGPFLCVQVKGDQSAWLGLTTQFRKERLPIDAAWRLHGSPKWQSEDVYVADGLSTYVGPNDAFVRAGAGELTFAPHARPHVSPEGVAAAIEESRLQGGPLLD